MDYVAQHAARQPERPAIIDGDRIVTWTALRALRDRLGHGLAGLGLRRGQHVMLYAENSLEALVAGTAARALGLVTAPMNHRLTTEEAAYIVDNADAAAVFVSDAFLPMAERLRAVTPGVRHWIMVGRERRPWANHVDDLVAAGRPEPLPETALSGSMIYTAGTTGKPKGARRGAVEVASLLPRLQALDMTDPAHVHLVAGPLYHSAPAGFALYTHVFGGTLVVMRKFEPEAALALIARHRCTSTFMAPTLVKRLVDLPAEVRAGHDVSSLRTLVMAGAPCPMRVKELAVAWLGPVLYEFYGSTELGVNTVLRPEDVLRKPGSCGRAAPGVELAILDDDGRPLAAGQPGQLYARRGPGMFDEYYKNAVATAEMAAGEWLTVGDVAWMDDEGFVYICDRKRDMIISGGVNIYPAEVEDALHRHPAIADVAVFGVPDAEWGERVHAAVHVRPGHTLTSEEVMAFARRHVADFKAPREVSFHVEFPRDTAGKLVKRVLREPYWQGRSARV